MKTNSFLLLIFTLALFLVGCEKSSPPASEESQPTLDDLRSLPYTSGAALADGDSEASVTVHDPARSYPGYNLYTIHAHARADLIDETGKLIHSWSSPPGNVWERCELLPNGDLVAIGAESEPQPNPDYPDDARYLVRFNWAGEMLWLRKFTAHHDVELNPQNQLAVLTFKRLNIPKLNPRVATRDDYITVLKQDGTEIDSISLLQAFVSGTEQFNLRVVKPSEFGGDTWVDLFHSNSVEWMRRPQLYERHPIYGPGNVLICSRHQDSIGIINTRKKRLIWSWGQGELSGPHDAQVLDSGNILVFDNGIHPDRQWSRVVELDPIEKKIVWEYKAPNPADFYTLSRGSAQRLANGNTLIACSDDGRAFEVTQSGDIVWEFKCPYKTEDGKRAAIIRMIRHDRKIIDRFMNK